MKIESVYAEKDVLFPLKSELVKKLKGFADKQFPIFSLSEVDIDRVLLLLSYYCVENGNKALPHIHKDTLLKMIQWDDDDGGVVRVETWAT